MARSNEGPSEEPDNEPRVSNVPNVPVPRSAENDASIVDQLPRVEAISKSMLVLIALFG